MWVFEQWNKSQGVNTCNGCCCILGEFYDILKVTYDIICVILIYNYNIHNFIYLFLYFKDVALQTDCKFIIVKNAALRIVFNKMVRHVEGGGLGMLEALWTCLLALPVRSFAKTQI